MLCPLECGLKTVGNCQSFQLYLSQSVGDNGSFHDDFAGTINVKPSGYSEGDLDLVANIKLLKTDRLPESINVKDEAVKLNESDAYRKRGTLVNGAKGDYLDFFLNIEEEGNYVLTYKVKDNEAVENGLKVAKAICQYDKESNLIKEYVSIIEASRVSGCDRRGIQRQLQNPVDPNNKRAWNNTKYIWRYKEELTEQSN